MLPTRLMMASILDTHSKDRQRDLREEIVAVVDAQEFDEARRDPRVRAFVAEADAYLADVERHARNS
jgi:hypothetical protein